MSESAKQRSILVNAAYLVTGDLVNAAARAFYAIAVAYVLGPEIYGLLGYGMSWYLILFALSVFGLDSVVGREIGRLAARGTGGAIRSALVARLVTLSGALIAGSVLILSTETDAVTVSMLWVFCLALVGRSIAAWSNAVFAARQHARQVLRFQGPFRMLEVAVGSLVLLFHPTLQAIVWVHALSWLGQGAASVLVALGSSEQTEPFGHIVRRAVTYLRMSTLVFVIDLSLNWILQGPIVLSRFSLGNEGWGVLGPLSLAFQVLFILNQIGWSIGRAALPVLSQDDESRATIERQFVRQVFHAGWILGGGAGLVAVCFAEPVIAHLFGEGYRETGNALEIIAWLVGPVIWAYALSRVILSRDHTRALSVIALSSTLPLPVAIFFLGAPVGTLLGTALSLVLMVSLCTIGVFRVVKYRPGMLGESSAAAVIGGLMIYLMLSPLSSWLAAGGALIPYAVAATRFGVQLRRESPPLRN